MYSVLEHLTKEYNNSTKVKNIFVGTSWICCQLDDNRTGICANFSEVHSGYLNSYSGESVNKIINQIKSDNILNASIGLSCLNALCNNYQNAIKHNCLTNYDTQCVDGLILEGKSVAIIGHMNRTYEYIKPKAENTYMFEKNPKYKDDIPESEEKNILPDCDIVIITGTTIINHTIDNILEYSSSSYKILLGPSVPLIDIPTIDRNSGFVISDSSSFIIWNNKYHGFPTEYFIPFLYKKS